MFSYTNDLHDALLNKSGTEFWKSWREKFGVSRTTQRVYELTNYCDIAVKFANYFEDLCSNLNSVRKSNLDDDYLGERATYTGSQLMNDLLCNVELLNPIISDLILGKAAGLDEPTSEHLILCHPALALVFTKLFNIKYIY